MIGTVGIVSTGDMGHATGRLLCEHGLRVVTSLQGRSPRTCALAEAAGISDAGDYRAVVRESDLILSILAPAAASVAAEEIAAAVRATGKDVLFVECNAVAPQTARAIGELITGAGAGFVDAGIIGPPPRPGSGGTRFYASGDRAGEFAQLGQYGLDVRVVGPVIGQASGLKMCYAALTKGLTALATELLLAAELMGLSETLDSELQTSQQPLRNWIERQLPSMPPKAYRWVGEMEEIATTFDALKLTPEMLQGAAAIYREVARTPLGRETPESRSQGTTLRSAIDLLALSLRASETTLEG